MGEVSGTFLGKKKHKNLIRKERGNVMRSFTLERNYRKVCPWGHKELDMTE